MQNIDFTRIKNKDQRQSAVCQNSLKYEVVNSDPLHITNLNCNLCIEGYKGLISEFLSFVFCLCSNVFCHRIIFLLCLSFAFGELSAQKLSLGYIYPAGGEKGTVVEIEIGGLNLSSATGVLLSGDGVKAEIIPINQKAEKNKKSKNKGK